MNFSQPPPNYVPQRPPIHMNLNQTKFTNQQHAPGRHPNSGPARHSNHSFGPRNKAPNGQPSIPIRHFSGRGPTPSQSHGHGPHHNQQHQMFQGPIPPQGQYTAQGPILKQQNGFHSLASQHSQVPNFVQSFCGPGGGVGQIRPQLGGNFVHQNGVFVGGIHSGQSSDPVCSPTAPSPAVLSNGTTPMFSTGVPAHLPSMPGHQMVAAGVANGSQVVSSPGVSSSPLLPSGMSSQGFQLPYNLLPQQATTGQGSHPGLVLQQPHGTGQTVPQGGALVISQQTPNGVQLFSQPGTPYPQFQPGVQGQVGSVAGGNVPVQYLVQGQPGVSPYLYQPQASSTPAPIPPPTPVPPTPSSANAVPHTQFPPPGLFSQPPPNYPSVSPSSRQISPRYHTPPKSPCQLPVTPSPVYMSPPMTGLVPVYPLTPGPTPDCVQYDPTHSATLPTTRPADIPDLRHQFLTNQFLPQPGQVVLLPPLPPDRSVQTIQLLTPGPGGQFSVQTIVLPIIKVENTMSANKVVPRREVDIKQNTNSEIVVKAEDDILLNEVDSTGLPKVMQGIDLEQVKQFAAEFKSARLSLGLTQTQVGQALTNNTTDEGVAVSQSTICRFEKLEITALQVKKLLPALQSWLLEAKERHKQGLPIIVQDNLDGKDNKKRKKRTVFNQDTVNALCIEFDLQPSPSSSHLAEIADRMGLDKETVRVWFCNKRQNLKKNTSVVQS